MGRAALAGRKSAPTRGRTVLLSSALPRDALCHPHARRRVVSLRFNSDSKHRAVSARFDSGLRHGTVGLACLCCMGRRHSWPLLLARGRSTLLALFRSISCCRAQLHRFTALLLCTLSPSSSAWQNNVRKGHEIALVRGLRVSEGRFLTKDVVVGRNKAI